MSARLVSKIVIVDRSPIRAAILEEGLREAGFTHVVHIRRNAEPLWRESTRTILTLSDRLE